MTSARRLVPCVLLLVIVWGALLLAEGDAAAQTPPRSSVGQDPFGADGLQMAPEEALRRALELTAALEEDVHELEDDKEREADFAERYDEARDLAGYVLDQDPLNVSAGYVYARLSVMKGRSREALSRLEAYVADPVGKSDWHAHKLLGDIYIVSYPQQAKASYREAVRLASEEPKALIGLAKAELKLNRAEEALEYAEKAIQRDTEGTAEYRAIKASALLYIDDRHKEAYEAAQDAVKLAEQKARENPGRIGLLKEAEQRYGLLIQCVVVMLSEYPDSAKYLIDGVHAYLDQADLQRLLKYHEALSMLETARANPDLATSGALLYEEARLNRLVGRDDRAVAVIGEIAEDDAAYQAAQELLRLIRPAAEGPSSESDTAPATP